MADGGKSIKIEKAYDKLISSVSRYITFCITYLHGNIVSVPETGAGDLERLFGPAEGLFGSFRSGHGELPLANLREAQTSAGGLPEEKAQAEGGAGLAEAFLAVLHSVGILVAVDLVDVDLGGSLLLIAVFLGEEELGQADLLLPPAHLGHGALGRAGEQIGPEGLEVLVVSTTAPLDTVLKIDEEGKIGNSAVIIAIGAEDLESISRKSGLLQRLGRSKLL